MLEHYFLFFSFISEIPTMVRKWVIFPLILVILFTGFSSVSATPPPAKIVASVVTNVVSALVKWLWSLKSSTKTTVSTRSMMKFEGGYIVETVFDGSKLGIEPYSVQVTSSGELLVLDSENSNIHKISLPLSLYSRPRLVTGSIEGYTGHVDGRLRDARMNHPKGITMDDGGNVYVADTLNMAIRKISYTGVTTIAGGKSSRGGGHVDGPSEDAKFSNDFDLVYVASSCSLLVIDRGNQAIREIQLNDYDCNPSSFQYDGNFHLGIAVLAAAGFFGYMLALLQQRVVAMWTSRNDSRTKRSTKVAPHPNQRPSKSVMPPLIPSEDEPETHEDGFFSSIGKLVVNTASSVAELFFKRTPQPQPQFQHQYQQAAIRSNPWPVQDSFVIPDGDEPPSTDSRAPTPQKTYPFMSKELEKKQKQTSGYYNGWQMGITDQQYQQMQMQMQQQYQQQYQQHHHRQFSSDPCTYYEKSCETNEIVFGAVQEQDGKRESVVIKAVDYSDPRYNQHNIRSRINYMGYSHGY